MTAAGADPGGPIVVVHHRADDEDGRVRLPEVLVPYVGRAYLD